MIQVKVGYTNQEIVTLKITGHADFSESGSDIVCAGVSSIVLTNLMYAQEHAIGKFTAKQATGLIDVHVESSTEMLQHLLAAIVFGLSSIEKEYARYIKIKYMEV